MFSVLGRAYPSTQQGQRTNSCGIITRSLSAANLFFISNGVMLAKLKTLPDILEKEGKFLTFTLEFKKEYKINTNFLCCIGFCNANAKYWRKVFSRDNENSNLSVTEHESVQPFKNFTSHLLAGTYVLCISIFPNPTLEVRLIEAGFTDQTIEALYILPFKVTTIIKLSMFQTIQGQSYSGSRDVCESK